MENEIRDEILERIVLAAELSEQEGGEDSGLTEVTLAVSGLVVSGEVISYVVYCEEALQSEDKPNYGNQDEPRLYIHLRNAKYYVENSGSVPFDDGLYWRGRISHVSGFSMGGFVDKAFEKKERNIRVAIADVEI